MTTLQPAGGNPAATEGRTSRIAGLDLVRAGAILGVMLCHTAALFEPQAPSRGLLQLGSFGVDAFFALSGFLIGGQLYQDLERGTFSIAAFWRRRWLRTLPAYFFYLGVNLLAYGWHRLAAGEFDPEWRYVFFIQNLTTQMRVFYPESWSLAVEEWFYVLFPLLLLALGRAGVEKTRAFGAACAAIILGVLAGHLATAGLASPAGEERFVIVFRLDAIAMGAAVVWLERKGFLVTPVARGVAFAGGLLGGGVVMAAYLRLLPAAQGGTLIALPSWTLLVCPAAVALLLPVFARIGSLPWPRCEAAVRGIATISYSMYLSNLSVAWVLNWIGRRFELSGAVAVVLFWLGTLGLSALTYRYIERPFIARYRRTSSPETEAALLAAAERGATPAR